MSEDIGSDLLFVLELILFVNLIILAVLIGWAVVLSLRGF